MKFDIKDVKSWATRNDVKVGDEGYFADSLLVLDDRVSMGSRGIIGDIRDRQACCFKIKNDNDFCFFLPLDAVKKDKPKEKRYRPFKSMRELTEILYGADWEYGNLSVGDSLWIRRKGDEHFHQNLLIISLGYNENDLISMNERSMQEWLDNFEFSAQRRWRPFGVEVKDE